MRELILNQHVFILAAIDPKSWGHAGHSAAARNQTVSTTVAPGKKCDSYLVKNARPGLITLAFWLNCNAKNKCFPTNLSISKASESKETSWMFYRAMIAIPL